MASTKTRSRDKNRFRKNYPAIRRRPVYELATNKETIIEVASLVFDNASSVIYTFEQVFPSVPVVSATSKDASVNVFISEVTTLTVTVRTSDPLQGTVELHALYVGSELV